MERNHAFTLAELWTAIALLALAMLFAHSIVGCGSGLSREQAQRMQNNTQLRAIHSGMILFPSGSRDFYPGVELNGVIATTPIPATPGVYGTSSVNGADVVYRITLLLRGGYISPEYLVSPAETNAAIVPIRSFDAASRDAGVVTENHYSYAMLNISDRDAARSGEWRATNNSRAPIISDRNIHMRMNAAPTGRFAQSIHTDIGRGWIGSVCWNDNHATFEKSDVLKTEYALKSEVAADLLFSDAEKSANGTAGADAAMVYKAGNSYVNQQP